MREDTNVPGWIDGICRRIVGALLNEGWTPPEHHPGEVND